MLVGGSYVIWRENPALTSGPRADDGNVTDFMFETADGQPITLSGLSKNRTLLVNVWATWCPPCRKEMPSLDRLQAKLGGLEFEVVAVSIDRTGLEAVKPFYTETGIQNLKIYLDTPGKIMSALTVTGLPTTILIGPGQREVQRWVGPKEWDAPDIQEEISRFLESVRPSAITG